jgi:hypothetical protein
MTSDFTPVARELMWDNWAKCADDSALTAAGRDTLAWATDVIRGFFGEDWLADNAAASGCVPLLNFKWWPLSNRRTIVRVLELAARIALVTGLSQDNQLSQEARAICRSRVQAGAKFDHLCVCLETAAFAILAGWQVSYEETSSTGRRPDLTIRRDGFAYSLEVSVMGFDREFRAADEYNDELHHRLRGLEHSHGVELRCYAREILPEADLESWIDRVSVACQQTAADGRTRLIRHRENEVEIFAAGKRPAGEIFRGPFISGDMWQRVAARIASKAAQTADGPAWIRIDDTGALFHLTERSREPLADLLADLHHNTRIALQDAPHVHGIILGTGALVNPGDPRDETVCGKIEQTLLIVPGPPRHILADGPAAMLRALPGGRSRLTFVLPGPHPHLALPSRIGPEPGLWYDDERSWLTRALTTLGHPGFDRLFRTLDQ